MSSSPLATLTDFLGSHAPFGSMTAEDLNFLARRVKLAFYAKGEVIRGPADGPADRLYIVREGAVSGESDQGGTSGAETVWHLLPGECFPIGALLAERPMHMTTRAAEDSACLELDRADFEELYRRSAEFHDFCARRMASLLDDALRDIQAVSAARVTETGSLSTPASKLVRRHPISCGISTPLRGALQTMDAEHIGSMIVTDEDHRPVGILTLYDILHLVTLAERPLDTPIGVVMLQEVLRLGPMEPAHEAALLMARHGRDHVVVVDEQDRLLGVLSERDLFSLQRIGLVSLSRAIGRAESVDTLARLGRDIHHLVEQMTAQGASVQQLTRIITELNDGIAQRVIALTVARQEQPPLAFTWLSFGSEGRFEQTLKTDQDNGILFVAPEGRDEASVREQLLPLAEQINQALDRCGFTLCPGNIMARNPECCLSLEEWRSKFDRWIDQGTPEHLLYATIFFDFRTLYGDPQPAAELRAWLAEHVFQNSRFRRQMAANAMRNRPALGLFGEIKVSGSHDAHPHTLDLKVQGVTPFVDGARLIALASRITETNTRARLEAAAKAGTLRQEDASAWIDAYEYIQLLRMRNHQRQAEQEQPLDNHFDPSSLNELDRRILKEAFRQARKLQSKITLDYQL